MIYLEDWIANAVGKMHINGITQNQVAEKMSVSYQYLSEILNGKKKPQNAEKRVMAAIEEIIAIKS